MENKTQNQPNNDSHAKGKKFDVFISYRYLPTKDNEKNLDHKHITSLARSIYQAFRLEGFHAFFDCEEGFLKALPAIDKSKYFIILFTQNSITALEKFPYESIKSIIKMENDGTKEKEIEGEGYNYARELYEIENRIKSGAVKKGNVFVLDIDGRYANKSESFEGISSFLINKQYKNLATVERIDFPTNKDFSIDKLINKKIKKSPRFSYRFCKAALPTCTLIALLALSFGYLTKEQLSSCNTQLNQYKNECILFAGGGTVKNYIDSIYPNANVNNYPGSKYVHIPSRDAWSLLWDDVNGCDTTRYLPIVLSTTKIDISEVDTVKLKEKIRIVEYRVGEAPLRVQVINDTNTIYRIDSINLKELYELLNTPDSKIHTTTSASGTYFAYKKLLDTLEVNLDTIIKKQGGRIDFNTCNSIEGHEGKEILLGNDYYYNRKYEIRLDRKIVSATMDELTVDLYVYTVAQKEKDPISKDTFYSPHKRVEGFLQRIGCKTENEINNNAPFIVSWK